MWEMVFVLGAAKSPPLCFVVNGQEDNCAECIDPYTCGDRAEFCHNVTTYVITQNNGTWADGADGVLCCVLCRDCFGLGWQILGVLRGFSWSLGLP